VWEEDGETKWRANLAFRDSALQTFISVKLTKQKERLGYLARKRPPSDTFRIILGFEPTSDVKSFVACRSIIRHPRAASDEESAYDKVKYCHSSNCDGY
jgi:hypothetical protein